MAITGTIVRHQTAAAGAASASIYPVFTLKDLDTAAPANVRMDEENVMEGFVGDGDHVVLPLTTDALEYYDNASPPVLQWDVTLVEVNAAVDQWAGFTFDETDSLIYGIGVDTTTTPDTFYTFSVNAAGTIVNIGNDQPTSDFTSPGNYWNVAPTSANSMILQRSADGSGNLFLRNGKEEAEINIATGAFVSDPAALPGSTVSIATPFKTTDGHFIGLFQDRTTNLSQLSNTVLGLRSSSGTLFANIPVPTISGVPASVSGCKLIPWKGYAAIAVTTTASGRNGTRQATLADINTFTNSVLAILGG